MENKVQDPDWELISKVANGDKEAFDCLVLKHQHKIINFCYRFTGNKFDAEDIAQEVFINVYKSAKRYKPKALFTTWIYRIATNLCLNYKRNKKRHPEESLEIIEENESRKKFVSPKSNEPDIQLLKQELSNLVQNTIQNLPENQKIALILHRFEGMSHQDIAESMNCSISAVESLIFRAKQNLKIALSDYIKA